MPLLFFELLLIFILFIMRVLQLCFFSNYWPVIHQVYSVDIKNNIDVLDLPQNFGKSFDIIISAPPCTQFTKANSSSWDKSPDYLISVAKKCFDISINSGKPWLLENPPGRIEKFLPGLTQYRIATWHGGVTNKEYIIYSNLLFLFPKHKRYGKPGSINNYSKTKRELWQPDFFQSIYNQLVF